MKTGGLITKINPIGGFKDLPKKARRKGIFVKEKYFNLSSFILMDEGIFTQTGKCLDRGCDVNRPLPV